MGGRCNYWAANLLLIRIAPKTVAAMRKGRMSHDGNSGIEGEGEGVRVGVGLGINLFNSTSFCSYVNRKLF